ncbi:MAG: alpha/beta fold hydrolase [Sedimentisphaerales bacterium]
MNCVVESVSDDNNFPDGIQHICYDSSLDNHRDYALFLPTNSNICFVFLHGHGSHGDQLYVQKEARDTLLPIFLQRGGSILTPNLRDNAWMSPQAAGDLHELLNFLRTQYNIGRFIFFSGSMGGTGNLIYAALFPQDVSAAVALGAATDLASYHKWCRCRNTTIVNGIAHAIESAYGGEPKEFSGVYKKHSVIENYAHLIMPVLLVHGSEDEIIPVSQARQLAQLMQLRNNFVYKEIANGDHDAPIFRDEEYVGWLDSFI